MDQEQSGAAGIQPLGAFSKLRDDNLIKLRDIVEQLGKESLEPGSNKQKLRDFYATAMDEAKLNEQGIKPLSHELDEIAKLKNASDLSALLGRWHAAGLSGLFSFGIEQDEKMSTRYAVILWQGGLGLPERDYYLGSSDYSKNIRAAYRDHVTKMFVLLGDSPEAAAKGADTVLAIETKLAEKSRTPVEQRDRENNYNKKTLHELADIAPNFDWDVYWKNVGVSNISDCVIGQPEFLERVNDVLKSVSMADWKTYLRWNLVHSTAPYLSDPIVEENFNFYGQQLRGMKQMQPRWKRAIGTIDRTMGEALGQLYVERYFPADAKKRMDEMVKNILAAYKERIESRDWMSPETKQQALAKLATVMPKIGYPVKWRDYTKLEIKSDSYVQNVLRAEAFDVNYRIARMGKPVDRDEWGMSPPTVNAYYNPTLNEIVFPAGILQPPFFNFSADDAVNYGSIGAVIGHEITHGFDDQGSRSDAEGNLRNWWTEEDRKRFNAKTDKLVKQFDDCVAVENMHVNGKLTLGENIADLGGLAIAYDAYQKSLHGKPAPVIDGFTGPQRFFIGYAQSWCESIRDAELKLMVRTNPHSPDKFRTLVPLSNFAPFYDAFHVQPGDTMYREPKDRVEVW